MSDYPPELAAVPTSPEDRLAAASLPDPGWAWESAPHPPGSDSARAASLLRLWSAAAGSDAVPGVVLCGGAGLGKTGIAQMVVRDAALRGDGDPAHWVYAASPRVRAAVASGDFRRRPAPAEFRRWRDLKSLLDRAKAGQLPWEEAPPLTAEKVLREVEERCAVLALDDVDVDAATPWKEEVLLRLLELPRVGRRLVLTMNVDPAAPEGVARLGERVVDRLMDPSVFARFRLAGDSARRRKW